jgi:hypothetical protein
MKKKSIGRKVWKSIMMDDLEYKNVICSVRNAQACHFNPAGTKTSTMIFCNYRLFDIKEIKN